MACTGLWGLALVLRKRGKERIPALAAVAFATVSQFVIELFRLRGMI
jgi:hypothetical protein